MDKKKIIKIITECAKKYKDNLENKNILFIFLKQNKELNYIETRFLSNNFLHLTGICFQGRTKNSKRFYKACIEGKIKESDIHIKKDINIIQLKLEILNNLMNINKTAKMIGQYSNNKNKLFTEKIVGNIRYCLGFIKKDKFYIPNTTLNEDIREVTCIQNRIIAILSKNIKDKNYNKLTYISKDFDFTDILNNSIIKDNICIQEILKYPKN